MYRVALGYDLHRLQRNSLGGVICAGIYIPCDYTIEGAHSDGDVVFHALTDALLSISGTDIGKVFPNTAAENYHRNSQEFLEYAFNSIKQQYRIINADIVVICDFPKISSYTHEMKHNISILLDTDDVSIRGKTTENTKPLVIEAYSNVLFQKILE
ncbi:MAG: 2-C-methyl-D-erythritol 2,4-cyclodiphosphate synthase [Brevinema sp.]